MARHASHDSSNFSKCQYEPTMNGKIKGNQGSILPNALATDTGQVRGPAVTFKDLSDDDGFAQPRFGLLAKRRMCMWQELR
ncbi:hypothetical protein [Paraburkholderia fungorum]|uniref:hypothetical protein n=1 Tax=Paraburkholderia fungorum TaxID=134537 RepID=UPI00161D6650|nr:hypothetical protein [Paraburkholderia fungorum]MBB5546692.1 hypothetical protein [Paraburkholderia fungorum]